MRSYKYTQVLLQFRKFTLLETTFRDGKLAQSLLEQEISSFPSLVVYDTPCFFPDHLVKMIQDLERLRSQLPYNFQRPPFLF